MRLAAPGVPRPDKCIDDERHGYPGNGGQIVNQSDRKYSDQREWREQRPVPLNNHEAEADGKGYNKIGRNYGFQGTKARLVPVVLMHLHGSFLVFRPVPSRAGIAASLPGPDYGFCGRLSDGNLAAAEAVDVAFEDIAFQNWIYENNLMLTVERIQARRIAKAGHLLEYQQPRRGY